MAFLDQFRMDGHVALITGAGRGIGLAIARAFADAGAAVAIQDLDRKVAEKEAIAIVAAGGRAIALGGDLTHLDDVERWPAEVSAGLGASIDVLVNNGSIQHERPFVDYPVAEIEAVFRANLLVPMRLAQLTLPAMRDKGWGRVLNVSSVQARRGSEVMTPYAATKAALEHFTRNLARVARHPGVTVNAIAPGWFDTYRNQAQLDRHGRKADWMPASRMGRPEDCVGAALLLCSDAGAYITGAMLAVDGGMAVA